jgi:hypothetical protein
VIQAARDVTGGDTMFAYLTAGASATARETDDGFVATAGSTARKQGTGTFPAGYRAIRDQLVQDGHLVDGPSPELFMFAVDVKFASPSAAASIGQRSARDWRAERLGEGRRRFGPEPPFHPSCRIRPSHRLG